MPEKVIHGGRLIPGAAEVEVPSWDEFNAAIARLWQKIDSVNDNKQAIWDVLDQFKEAPPNGTNTDFQREVRKLYDKLQCLPESIGRVNEIKDLWRAVDQLTPSPNQLAETPHDREIRKTYEDIRHLENRYEALPDALRETVRDAIRTAFEPLFGPAAANIDSLLKDNCALKNSVSSLSDALEKHRGRFETLEKQIRELPHKARAVLLGSILAELQPQLDSAKADIASLQSANDELKNGIDSLHTELSSCQTNLKQGLASSQEANSSLKQEINSLRSELSSCQTGLKQELASAQEANSKLKAEIDSLRTELSTCQTGLKQELASTQEANSKLETEIASLHTELSTCQANLKQEVTSSLEASTRLEAEINSLRAELSTCQANLDAHLNPPKKQGFFKRLYFRMLKFFRSKTFSDTNTPPPQGS